MHAVTNLPLALLAPQQLPPVTGPDLPCLPLHFSISPPALPHLHCSTKHAGATQGAHEHILTARQRLFTKRGWPRGE